MDKATTADFSGFRPKSFYIIDPYSGPSSATDGNIHIGEIAERVYGKYLNGLDALAEDQDGDALENGALVEYTMSNDFIYERALEDFDREQVALGRDSNYREIIKTGMTRLDYWLSISWSDDPEKVTVPDDSTGVTDYEGAVFSQRYLADRVCTPGLEGVIADLIRRGEIPRGDYLFSNEW